MNVLSGKVKHLIVRGTKFLPSGGFAILLLLNPPAASPWPVQCWQLRRLTLLRRVSAMSAKLEAIARRSTELIRESKILSDEWDKVHSRIATMLTDWTPPQPQLSLSPPISEMSGVMHLDSFER